MATHRLLFVFATAFFLLSVSLTAGAAVTFGDDNSAAVSFANDVIPILTKAGCNAGTCHAKAGNGQNGFHLSLLGFEAAEDYERIVREGRGRRISTAAPDRSLLLQKAAGITAHGGGVRLAADSPGYQTLRRWIAEGAKQDFDTAAELVEIRVEPERARLEPGSSTQLKAVARYDDGSLRDVTDLALFETNDDAMAEVGEDGRVKVHDIPGRAAVMVRFQGRVSVFTAAVPLGAPVASLPPSRSFIDEAVFGNLQELGIPPSPLCDDTAFLRRVSLDIAGRLPTPEEAAQFAASDDPNKRDSAIDALLDSPGYADFFANKWTALLKNRRENAGDITTNFAFHSWLRDSLAANAPYDRIVRELLAATGVAISNPPVAWYKRVTDPKEQLEDVAQLFLGVRMQCAQCHHHPFERWSQDDYYSLAAFFTQIGRKPTGVRGEDMIFHRRGVATATNIKTGKALAPAALGDAMSPIAAHEDPRLKLADWMRQDDNPYFAKALVNRYWKHFFRRGLIEPEDDIRDTNPPTNPELLQALEDHFVASGFDLKELVRVITRSSAYQLSSIPNEHNVADFQNYSRYYPRRLQAEVLLDAVDDVTQSRTDFANLPAGTRAIALPDNSYNRASPFLKVFGRPDNQSVCECERVQSSSLAQSLHLLNSDDIKNKLKAAGGRAHRLAEADLSDEERVGEIYLAALGRPPGEEELRVAGDFLAETAGEAGDDAKAKRHEAFQDLLWALINSKEFLFNH